MDTTQTKTQELFREIGRKLKAARDAKGIGVGELSANIRINQGYLQSIEAGDLGKLPALTFLRGFIRNYAVAVGLDEAEILADFKRLVEAYNPGPMPLEPPAEVSPQPFVTFSPTKAILFAVLIAMVGWAVYLIVQVATAPDIDTSTSEARPPAAGPPAPASPAPPAAGPAPDAPGPSAATQRGDAPPPARAGAPAPEAALPTEPPRSLQLTLRGLERSWVRLSIDRREPVDVYLQPAETGEWEANEEFRITIGKSHGVSVYLNGEEVLLPKEDNLLIPEIVLNKLTLLKLEN